MNPIYAPTARPLNAEIEALVRSRLRSDELVYQWTEDQGIASVCLVQAHTLEGHSEASEAMGGLCAGGGRLLKFKKGSEAWSLVDVSEWIS